MVDLGSKVPKDFGQLVAAYKKLRRKQNWRPGGWQIATMDDAGRLYVLMHKDGKDGTHKSGGPEVWVLRCEKTKQRVQKNSPPKTGAYPLKSPVARKPLLAVTNGDMQIDVYEANQGTWKNHGGRLQRPCL